MGQRLVARAFGASANGRRLAQKKRGMTGTGPITVARRGRRGTWRIARERDDERRETRGSGRFARERSGPPPAEIARASRSARPTVRRVAFGRADLAVGGRHNGAKLCSTRPFSEFYAVCVLSQRIIFSDFFSKSLSVFTKKHANRQRSFEILCTISVKTGD